MRKAEAESAYVWRRGYGSAVTLALPIGIVTGEHCQEHQLAEGTVAAMGKRAHSLSAFRRGKGRGKGTQRTHAV